jgi:hypothetical protein
MVNIFTRNHVDAVVPFGIQAAKHGKLLNLPLMKSGKIFKKIQRFKDSKIQRFQNSKIPKFKDSKIQRFQNSKI